ncbi:MAG: aspartate carbamoyltransferase [Candidatus Levyibacteriota bacterium]
MTPNSFKKFNGKFKGQDILSIEQFSTKDLEKVFSVADKMKKVVTGHKPSKMLSGYVTGLIFYEPSTRTFSSFSSAAKRLGAATVEHQNPLQASSVAKGESLEDTMKILEANTDAIVMRHPEPGSAARAAGVVEIPVINAGDGPNQHPTQTLLDLLTIKERLGRLNNLKVAFVGDPLHYRVFHGQFAALSGFKGNQFYGISPKGLEMPKEYRNAYYHDVVIDMKKLNETLAELKPDIVSIGRIPKEYIKGDAGKYKFVINSETLKSIPKKSIIMHPLPRIDEVSTDVDDDPRAVYFKYQVRNGLYIRMALLSLVLGKIK